MAPRRAATTKAPANAAAPKANTKAKITKPAPSRTTKRVAATEQKKVAAEKALAAATKGTTKPTKAASQAKSKTASKAKSAAKATGEPKSKAAPKTKTKAEPKSKPAPKSKAAAKKAAAVPKPAAAPKTSSTKRKRDDNDEDAAPAPKPVKKAKVIAKGPVINEAPTQRLNVYVFGEGTAGELALGTSKKSIDVKRPRLNPNLDAEKVGVVQLAAGGMHAIALTADNKLLTWGVNDNGALGRSTAWEGGLKDMDQAQKEENDDDDSEDEDDDNGLNPHESTPGEVDFSTTDVAEGTRWVQVAAGDSTCFALTDDGRVYGWGSFRSNKGPFGFTKEIEEALRPMLIPDLKKITQIKAGANHALALDSNGAVWAWGSGEQSQLGRKLVERTNELKKDSLLPRQLGLPKGPKKGIAKIETGAYHSFAISKTGDVYSWGLNNMGQTGHPENAGEDGAAIDNAKIITALKGKEIISIGGGSKHSVAASQDGDCLVWGEVKGSQMGIAKKDLATMPDDIVQKKGDEAIMVLEPIKVPSIEGAVCLVASNSDQNVVVTTEGKAWSWGFSANYQTGQGTDDDVEVATLLDNTAIRAQRVVGAACGGQFGALITPA